MAHKIKRRLIKILRINRIDKRRLTISVLFSNGEDRLLNFDKIFRKEWKITSADPEYKLLNPDEFAKVKVTNHTLTWDNAGALITGANGRKKKVAFDAGADTLYALSEPDEKLNTPVGALFRKARLKSKLSQEKVAQLAGTSRTYITKLENGKQDVELKTLKKMVEAGLDKRLTILIE
jgi:DNA-binding XRE family transcriptional regulator